MITRIEKILKNKGFDEMCPSRNHHTFVNHSFIVLVYFWGKVVSIRQ